MTDEAKALVERVETLPDTHALPSTLALLFDLRDCVETQAREIERLTTILSAMNDTDVIARTMAENERLREALFNAIALIGHSVPMDTTALVAGELLTANGVWHQGRAALAGGSHDQ